MRTSNPAKPSAKPVDIRETYRDTIKRFPLTMALLAGIALSGCVQTRYVRVYCVSKAQLEQLAKQKPAKIRDQLTGQADQDLKLVTGRLVRVESWGDGLLDVLGGCVDPNK